MTTKEMFDYDRALHLAVAGCDEAGRGPLAGPVVCAACIMPLDNIIEGINDSKKLTDKKRRLLFAEIKEKALAYRITAIDNKIIDEINILQATRLGMETVINSLEIPPDIVLIDAVSKLNLIYDSKSIIKGDATSYNIAAASILAKVTRDDIMIDYDKIYPEYNFASHKGYGTSAHIAAIRKFGLTPIHRKLFVRNFTEEGLRDA